jgi:hypothetical protein
MSENYFETAVDDKSIGGTGDGGIEGGGAGGIGAVGAVLAAGMLIVSCLGRYSGPGCPHADSMSVNTATMIKETHLKS